MNKEQRSILASYVANDELDILSISFLKGGNVSKDSLSIQYYRKTKGKWNLCTDSISPSGEIETRTVPAIRN